MNLIEKLSEGPLRTTVYAGTYRPMNFFGRFGFNQSRSSRNVLVKRIDKKIIAEDIIDWEALKTLCHPNVACYTTMIEKFNLFKPNWIYIIQDYCQFTLQALLDYHTPIHGNVLKVAVLHIASGLKYLHDKEIVHMNLKPSNILVKPPLSNPECFVLTDYGYTFYRSYRRKNFFCCLSDKFESSDPHKYQWMAPEFMVHRSAFIKFNPFKTKSMIDLYSFGKILITMYSNCDVDSMDVVNRFLYLLLFEQLVLQDWNSEDRITCDEILSKHPYVIIQPDQNSGGYAEARMSYIKGLYDRMNNNPVLRKHIDEKVERVTRLFFPWNEPENSFGARIYSEMNKRPQIRQKYDGNSFVHLLRLIRNKKEHPIVEKKLKNLKEEVDNDAFSTNFPHVIPIIYVCVECPNTSEYLLRILSGYTEMT